MVAAVTGSASGLVTGGHEPRRPDWWCVRCGRAWPCPGARVFLRSAYVDNRVTLGVYLSAQLFTAAGDLGAAELSPELLERFLSWASPREES